MDIPRPFAARRRRIRHILYLLTAIASIAAISAGLSRLEPAAPRVDRSTLWMGEVKRGDLTRRVRGLGKLIPEVIRWIPAATQGRVERVLIQPGERVIPETVILELSNPELEQQALDAQSQLKRAEAEMSHLRIQLEGEKMQLQADAARVESDYLEATLKAEADAALLREGLVSEMDTKISRSRADAQETQRLLEKKRMDIFSKSLEAQLEAKEAEVEQRRLLHGLRRSQLESLRVRPGFSQEDGSASLFRIEPDGIHAQRIRVDLGASSVSEIQVLEGLNLGDQVVLSDMAQWKDHDRIRLE